MLLKISCNALDGMVARETNQQSQIGAWLNETTDIVADLLLFGVIMILMPNSGIVGHLIIALVLLIEVTGLFPLLKQRPRIHFGPFSKSDRAVYLSIVALILWIQPTNDLAYTLAAGLGLLLASITCARQLRHSLRK